MVEWWKQNNYRSGLWKTGKKCEINNFYERFNSDLFHFKKPQIIFFIHSSVNGRLGCFHVLAIVDRAASLFLIILLSGCMPRSGTSRSYGNSVVF